MHLYLELFMAHIFARGFAFVREMDGPDLHPIFPAYVDNLCMGTRML